MSSLTCVWSEERDPAEFLRCRCMCECECASDNQLLDTVPAQGYLVFNVVSAGADANQGLVGSHTAEEQGVRLEQTVFGNAVGRHQVWLLKGKML